MTGMEVTGDDNAHQEDISDQESSECVEQANPNNDEHHERCCRQRLPATAIDSA
jgi:hypothetical protein